MRCFEIHRKLAEKKVHFSLSVHLQYAFHFHHPCAAAAVVPQAKRRRRFEAHPISKSPTRRVQKKDFFVSSAVTTHTEKKYIKQSPQPLKSQDKSCVVLSNLLGFCCTKNFPPLQKGLPLLRKNSGWKPSRKLPYYNITIISERSEQ